MQEKHLKCVVLRYLSHGVFVDGGYEAPRLAGLPADMVVELGNTRYCIHFTSLRGDVADWLNDPQLKQSAQTQARSLVQRRYGLPVVYVPTLPARQHVALPV